MGEESGGDGLGCSSGEVQRLGGEHARNLWNLTRFLVFFRCRSARVQAISASEGRGHVLCFLSATSSKYSSSLA
eukprot:1433944-Prymnesium_polylepis.1